MAAGWSMNATGWMEYVLVFSTQRGNLKLLAIATPHQSRQNIGSEMPIFHRDSFPPGEAKGRLRELIPFNVPICSGNGGEPRRLRRSGRQVGDPYKLRSFWRFPFIVPLSCVRFGRRKEPPLPGAVETGGWRVA